jgi:glucokinase
MIGAIDVGGTKVALGLVDERGAVIARSETPSTELMRYAEAVPALTRGLERLARQAGAALDGIGIGLTGRVDFQTGRLTENEFFPDWGLRDLAGDLSEALGVSVAMENDADAAALAEARWGAGQGYPIFIYVTVSTGIGGGIVLNGQLYRGARGWHPEIGHQVVAPPDTPLCYCGARGCWEQKASGPALAAWYAHHGGAALTTAEICALAARGDALALSAVDNVAGWLGLGLGNLIGFYAPDCIAQGGGVMRSWALFEPRVRAVIAQHCSFLTPPGLTQIVPARLGGDAPLAGAACVWLQRYS